MKKEYDFTRGKRGPVLRASRSKTRITIRIDDDVLEWFRDQVRKNRGGNYQTLMNEALRRFTESEGKEMEETIRRVLREELTPYVTLRSDRSPRADATGAMSEEVARRKAEIQTICRRFGVHKLELFGSAASNPDLSPDSDLDFLVEFGALPAGTYADAFFGFLESLEELFGRPVDLVVASAIRNPYFQQAIERTRVLLYAD